MKLRTLTIVCAALVTSSALAQNSGSLPITGENPKLDKPIVGTGILGMRDAHGNIVATFHFQTIPGKCPIYRIPGFEFVQMVKLDNILVDSIDTTLFPSFDAVARIRQDRRPNFSGFNSRLDRMQIGPQILFMGPVKISDAGVGDNAIFSHAVTKQHQRITIAWVFESSRERRNNLQDSLPVVIRDVERGQERVALTAMAQAGWEFTSLSDQQMFSQMARMSQMPDSLQQMGLGQDLNDSGRQTDTKNLSGSTVVDPTGLDAQPVVFRFAGSTCTGTIKTEKGGKLEIEKQGSFCVTTFRVAADGTEKSIFSKTYTNLARLTLDLKSGCVYRIEVRDPANSNKLMATIRLEAK